MAIRKNDIVSLAYEVRNEDGIVVDESTKEQPLQYLHGHQNLIQGLENALEGKEVGNRFEIQIEPKDAYGEYSDDLVQRVPAEIFQSMSELTVGMRFLADTDHGAIPVEITAVEGDEVVVDANHMLAGETLSFSVEILDIRPATEEEIAHGHVHQTSDSQDHDCCGKHDDDHQCCGSHGKKKRKKEGCCGRCH